MGICCTDGVPLTGDASRAVEKLLPGDPKGEADDSRRLDDATDWTGRAREELDADRSCDAMTAVLVVCVCVCNVAPLIGKIFRQQ